MNKKQMIPLVLQRKAIFTHLKGVTWKVSLMAMLISLLTVTVALAASGDLDTSFDGDGWLTTDVNATHPGRNDIAADIALQSDGKIVAAGYSFVPSTTTEDFAITRYKPDGSPDATFSGDGSLITNFGGEDSAYAVAIQSNGKIVVAGNKCSNDICDMALARYNANGKLDITFSGDGKQITDFGGNDNRTYGGIVLTPNDKILLTGYMMKGTDYNFAVYRYNPNGTPDTTFSADGKVSVGFGAGKQSFGEDLVRQSDGKIVVAGETCDLNYASCNFAIVRLTAGGTLDTAFSGDGRLVIDMGGYDVARSVAVQPDGRIILAGYKRTAAGFYFALARLNTDGSLDKSFNGTGKKSFGIGDGGYAIANDVLVQADGAIVTFGTAKVGATDDFALVRLTPNGALDSTFSGDGKVTVDLGGNTEAGYTLDLQPDGSYVVGGYTYDGSQIDFALARILP